MFTLFVLVSLGALVFGVLFLSEATTGVGIIGIACYFAILARLAQASQQHAEVRKLLETKPAPQPRIQDQVQV